MKTKYLLIGLATALVMSTAVAYVVYSTTKRKYSPKMHAGELYIDHTEGDGNPSIYLNITIVIYYLEKIVWLQLKLDIFANNTIPIMNG